MVPSLFLRLGVGNRPLRPSLPFFKKKPDHHIGAFAELDIPVTDRPDDTEIAIPDAPAKIWTIRVPVKPTTSLHQHTHHLLPPRLLIERALKN